MNWCMLDIALMPNSYEWMEGSNTVVLECGIIIGENLTATEQ